MTNWILQSEVTSYSGCQRLFFSVGGGKSHGHEVQSSTGHTNAEPHFWAVLLPGKPCYFLSQSELLFHVIWETRIFVSQLQMLFHLKNQSTTWDEFCPILLIWKYIYRLLWLEARLSPSILALRDIYIFNRLLEPGKVMGRHNSKIKSALFLSLWFTLHGSTAFIL